MNTSATKVKKAKPVKVLKVKLYSFDQLGSSAKQKAIDDYRNSRTEYFWQDENRESMEKFSELFDIKVTNWSYGERGEGVSFVSNYRGEIEEMTGQRLATWLYNNFGDKLWKPKYIKDLDLKKVVKHNRIKSKDYNNGNFGNPYYSAIFKDTSCVLTGYYMDDTILEPMYDFIDKPDDTSFLDLLENCFNAWVKGCNLDIDSQNSDDYITDELNENGKLFEVNGTIHN